MHLFYRVLYSTVPYSASMVTTGTIIHDKGANFTFKPVDAEITAVNIKVLHQGGDHIFE